MKNNTNNLYHHLSTEILDLCTIDIRKLNGKLKLKAEPKSFNLTLDNFLGELDSKINKIFFWKSEKNFKEYCLDPKNKHNDFLKDIKEINSKIIAIIKDIKVRASSAEQVYRLIDEFPYRKILDLWKNLMNEIFKMFNTINEINKLMKNQNELNERLCKASKYNTVEEVKLLIKEGADVNAVNQNGYSALMCASLFRKYDIVKVLLDNGADVNYQNELGNTALKIASDAGYDEIIDILQDHINKQKEPKNNISVSEAQKELRKVLELYPEPNKAALYATNLIYEKAQNLLNALDYQKEPEPKEPKKYKWFISYNYTSGKVDGFGDFFGYTEFDILANRDNFLTAKEELRNLANCDSVIILNIIRLGENE